MLSPGGNIFTNGEGSLTLEGHLYKGATEVTSGVTWAWAKLTTSWTTVSGTTSSITVSGSAVDGYAVYRCTATYDSKDYVQYFSFFDYTDPLQVTVMCTLGTQIKNSQGIGAIYALVTRNGEEVDPLKSDRFLFANPSSPSTGDLYYRITGGSTRNVRLYRYSGSSWSDVTTNATYREYNGTYEWTFLDANGNIITPTGIATTGKVIYVDAAAINGKITANCKVTM